MVTQADVDAGTVTNTATVNGTDPLLNVLEATDTEIVPVIQTPSIALDKQAPVGTLAVGEVLTYTFVVTNDGDVTLTNVRVDDPLVSPVVCADASLAPAASTTCTGDYTVTQADVDAGEIINTATASGDGPSGSVTSTDTEVTGVPAEPGDRSRQAGPGGTARDRPAGPLRAPRHQRRRCHARRPRHRRSLDRRRDVSADDPRARRLDDL